MKLVDALRDIVAHFTCFAEMQSVTLTPAKNCCLITARWEGHVAAIRSYFRESIEDLPVPIGIYSTSLLAAIFAHPSYADPDVRLVNVKDRWTLMIAGDDDCVHAIDVAQGMAVLSAPFWKEPSLKEKLQFVVRTPIDFQMLNYWCKQAKAEYDDETITFLVRRRRLLGGFRISYNQFMQFALAKGVDGELEPMWEFRTRLLLPLLKLNGAVLQLTGRPQEGSMLEGLAVVKVDSGPAVYRFLVPGSTTAEFSWYEDYLDAMNIDYAEARMAEFAEE